MSKQMIQPENGGQTAGGTSKDMALIGDTKHELHTKSLPRKDFSKQTGRDKSAAGKAEGTLASDNDGDE